MRRFLESAVVAFAAVFPAQAAPPLITEDTATQGKGGFQLEFTIEHARASRSGASYDGSETSVVLNYGVAENIDLQFIVPYVHVTEETAAGRTVTKGVLDAYLNLKWRFYERDTLSFAVLPSLIVPTGSAGLSSERVNPGARLIASYEPGAFAVHADGGYRNFDNVQGLREHLYHLSAAVMYTVHDTVKLVADQSVETSPDPASSNSIRYTTLGAIWIVTPGVGLGCGVKHGHGGLAIDHSYICGLGMRQ